jgi:hypothetical protein
LPETRTRECSDWRSPVGLRPTVLRKPIWTVVRPVTCNALRDIQRRSRK